MNDKKNINDENSYTTKLLDVIYDLLSREGEYKCDEITEKLLLSEDEKIKRVRVINEIPSFSENMEDSLNDYKGDYVSNTIFKAMAMLELLGYTETAKELFFAGKRVNLERQGRDSVLNWIVNDSIKKQYSSAASSPRHTHYNEIMGVIKATWEKHPEGSKKEMIRRVMERYGVDETTLKRWIKKSRLTPVRPERYKNFSLVIPK
ncbi:hypothetical protein KSL88_18840 [Pectobacterium polaris]|uniref:hypothetical protein n=1 Tax=Pectobacterium polaris TaxID=2042057 RepID=UPI001CC6DF5A|nr:hypothetical protein [Pectobacterium polaris]UAY91516.1 hypothetical protein KSL88_18840 [Pectobacterium polaris]